MSFSGQHPIGVTDATKWPTLPTTGDHADNLLAGRLATLEAGAGTGGEAFARATSDVTRTSTAALADDNELFFDIGANEIWEFDLLLLASGGSAGDIQWTFSVPAGATGGWGHSGAATGATGGTDTNTTGWQIFGDSAAVAAGLNATLSVIIQNTSKGVVINGGTAGRVTLRWAQASSNVTGTIRRAASFLSAKRRSPIQPAGANYGAMQLVGSVPPLAAAAQDLDFTGLNLDADVKYILVLGAKNAIASTQAINLFYNGDVTAGNYETQYVQAINTTITGARTNNAQIAAMSASDYWHGEIWIQKPVTGTGARAQAFGGRDSGASLSGLDFKHQYLTTGNVTSVKVRHASAVGFAIGTYAYLYRLAPVPLAIGSLKNYYFVRKTADESVTSSTTLQDDDVLSFAVAASEQWKAEFDLAIDAATAGDVKLAVNVPSGATGRFQVWGPDSGATASPASMVQFSTTDLTDTGVVTIGGFGAGTAVPIRATLTLINSTTAGTVKLRWAQGSSSATASKMLTNSTLEARRVA